jgi:RND family efflux transporter MFP subunit
MRSQKKIALVVLVATVLAGVVAVRVLRQRSHAGPAEQAALYYCPMHPHYTSPRPGECPICHMQLVKREPEEKPAVSAVASAQGYAAVLLSPQKRQLIGVKTVPARKQALTKKIRAVGLVKVDETRIKHVHPKVEGWIDEIFAKYEGDTVRKGQPLFSFHSPDFLSAQKEYLTTLESLEGMPETIASEVRRSVRSNLEAARQRLLWWGVTEEQIEALEKNRTPSNSVRLSSPIDGVVLRKHVWPGEYMERGADFYHIADLSSVWVDIALYEMDLPLVSHGQEVAVEWPSRPGEPLRGKLIYVAQFLNPETRTATARLELSNPDGLLRPDQYVTAEISVDLGKRLVVPAEAVLDSGTRRILFVDKGEGLLEPREVTVGVKGDGLWEIVRGVSEGEPVVVNGNFLVDSESRLKAALEGAAGQGHQHGQ